MRAISISPRRLALVLGLSLALAACATAVPSAASAQQPGFLLGLLHGFILPFAWIGSLFSDTIAIYAVPNNGGWYDFGFVVGVVILGGGSHGRRSRAAD
ncbi:hypothetical protein E2493_05385 [Sphingomonas parva]|uniref:Uncharacterized protein n=1 Tax=Sphingomonas parva TaxID=2555898 RepID=A0A4Y8ZTN0_9SPHN|nr:hypothetical protein [Sphingomonas parva]TFI59274.1 hypothetical protein E2493_05385 [Sphingomonas parva]